MDQYIYKTFKVLQNGLYWSFYCCSSFWIFIQIVKIWCHHHFAQFTSVREKFPELASNGQSFSKLSSNTLADPTLQLPVPPRDNKESNERRRRLFSFHHLPFSLWTQKKRQKTRICMGRRQTKNFGSEWKYVLMSLHVRIHFIWHVHCSSPIHAPVLPFIQYLHQKSILNSMSQSILNSAPKG